MSLFRKTILIDKPFVIFSLLTCIALFVRYFIALQDLTYLDRLFLPDDTFYTLSISRSIVAGLGPSVNGIHLTNGFQPLISFLQLPIFYFGFNGDQALILAIYLSVFFGGLSTLILGYLLLNLSSMRAAIIGSLLWAFCPIIIKNDLNGMETSLAGFLSLLAILYVVRIDKEKNNFRLLCLGIVCGLAFLARVDTCFLLVAIGIFALVRWGIYSTAIVVSLALLVVLPWWIYSLKTFGTIIPESGAAIKEIIVQHNVRQGVFSLASLYTLVEWFPLFNVYIFTFFLGLISTIYVVIKGSIRAGIYSIVLLLPFLLQLSFYTFYLPVFWFLSRYFYFLYLVIIIFVSLLLDSKNDCKLKRSSYVFVSLFLLTFCAYLLPFLGKPDKTGYSGFDAVKGYRETALEISAHLSPGDIVGALQSGALSYYAPPSVRIINLDGVVSGAAATAFKQKKMKDYVDSQHINRFADWEYNATVFKFLYGATFPESCFIPIYRAKKQGEMQFILYSYSSKCN